MFIYICVSPLNYHSKYGVLLTLCLYSMYTIKQALYLLGNAGVENNSSQLKERVLASSALQEIAAVRYIYAICCETAGLSKPMILVRPCPLTLAASLNNMLTRPLILTPHLLLFAMFRLYFLPVMFICELYSHANAASALTMPTIFWVNCLQIR